MPRPVSAIRNLGPASVKMFANAGMHSAEAIESMGADAAYRQLILHGTRPHFIGFYALVMGLQGRLWSDLHGEEKTALRLRFDALVAGVSAADKSVSAFEATLNLFGVGQPTSSRPAKK